MISVDLFQLLRISSKDDDRKMAIIKMQPVKVGACYALKAVLEYIMNPEKTENGGLVSAKDCMLECAYKQMLLIKRDFKQEAGRQYIHLIQSFAVDDKLNSETAHEIGQKLLVRFEGFQGVIATHTDRRHIHNHIVLNSVNSRTGYKWQQTPRDLKELKAFSDQLCREYGLSIIEKDRGKGWKSYGENKAFNSRGSWKAVLAKDVAECIAKSADRQVFIHYLKERGIEVDFGCRNIIFSLKNGLKCSGEKLMAYGDFSIDNIKQYFNFNDIAVNNGFQDCDVLFKAYQLVGSILKPDKPDYLVQKYANDSDLSGLEGHELVNAILTIKENQYREMVRQQNAQTMQEKCRPDYYLMTITELLKMALEEKNHMEYERSISNNYDLNKNEDEEWEYEL